LDENILRKLDDQKLEIIEEEKQEEIIIKDDSFCTIF
jgi:hypothetical protein